MSQPAPELRPLETAAIEGLEDLFAPAIMDGQARPGHGQANTSHGQATPDHQSAALTIDEAAAILGVTSRTILRRLQKQSLSGFKIAGQFGPEWRVLLSNADSTPTQANTSHGQTTPDHIDFQIIPSENELVTELRRQIDALKAELESKVSEAQREIQAASFRNGYLESQLENQRDQIKLLTDSQHKPGWWARFKKWCAGT